MKLKLTNTIAFGLAGLLLCGCGRKATAPDVAASQPTKAAGMLQAQHDALDRARAVEGQIRQQAMDQEKAIAAATDAPAEAAQK